MHMAQRYRPQTALFGRQWIIEVGRMDGKSGFGATGDREMYAFKFRLLIVLLWVFTFILADFIVRAPMRLLCDTARSKSCDRIV